jgi:hypothetical protein
MEPLTILGIDPSADITGVALVRFDVKGTPDLLYHGSFDAYALAGQKRGQHTSLRHRLTRIKATRDALVSWCHDAFHPVAMHCPDVLAWEAPFGAGFDAQTINQAIGAYASLSRFDTCRVVPVAPISIKALWGGVAEARAKAPTTRAKAEKRRRAKLQSVVWAREQFCLELLDSDDAISDACGVTMIAYRELLKQAAQQRTGPRARGGKV